MKNITVYYVHCKYLYELMLMFSVNSRVNWTQEGMKILLYTYYKAMQFQDVQQAIKFLSKWEGNDQIKEIGRTVLRVGDIFKIDDQFFLFVCKKLVKIPQFISNRLIIYN